MNLVDQVRIITIPRWLRWLLVGLCSGFLILTCLVIFLGFQLGPANDRYEFWIPAGTTLLSVIIPVAIFAAFAAFAHSGSKALRIRTNRLLVERIPTTLSFALESGDRTFRAPKPNSPKRDPSARLEVIHFRNDCGADYRMTPMTLNESTQGSSSFSFRIEINVKKINIAFHFKDKDLEAFELALGKDGFNDEAMTKTELILARFKHSILGASGSGWKTNTELVKSEADQASATRLVLFRDLSPDFLWDSSEQLYLLQDIQLLIRSMWNEGFSTGVLSSQGSRAPTQP